MVEQGTLQMLSGTYPLEEILTYERCPGDYIIHVLGCTTCLRRFRLSVDLAAFIPSSLSSTVRPSFAHAVGKG
jgi:hypothetical protein